MSEVPVKTKKRFIAGAVCPACSEPDKLMMWSEDNTPHRECVACGYSASFEAMLATESIPPQVEALTLARRFPRVGRAAQQRNPC